MIEYHKLSPPKDLIIFPSWNAHLFVKEMRYFKVFTKVGVDRKIVFGANPNTETVVNFDTSGPLILWVDNELGMCVDYAKYHELHYVRKPGDMFKKWHVLNENNCLPMGIVKSIFTTSDVLITDPYSMYEFLAQ